MTDTDIFINTNADTNMVLADTGMIETNTNKIETDTNMIKTDNNISVMVSTKNIGLPIYRSVGLSLDIIDWS